MWWIVLIVVLALVLAAAALSAYLTAVRLDRLHIRTDLAAQSLRNALVRRHTVAVAVADALHAHGESNPDDPGHAGRAGAAGAENPVETRLERAVAEARRASSERFTPGAPQTRIEQAENDLTRALRAALAHEEPEKGPGDGAQNHSAPGPALSAEAAAVGDGLEIARRFYNDAVRDTRRLRERRIISLFRLAGSAAMPEYIEMMDPS